MKRMWEDPRFMFLSGKAKLSIERQLQRRKNLVAQGRQYQFDLEKLSKKMQREVQGFVAPFAQQWSSVWEGFLVTELEAAIITNDAPAVLSLLLCTDVDLNPKYREAFLHMAARLGFSSIVDILCRAGAEIDAQAKDKTQWTALQTAVCVGNEATVDCLLRHGAKRVVQEGTGSTLLHLAVIFKDGNQDANKVAIIQGLLAAGLDPRAKNNQQVTPAELARAVTDPEIKAIFDSLKPCVVARPLETRMYDAGREKGIKKRKFKEIESFDDSQRKNKVVRPSFP